RAFDILKLIEIGVEYNKYHNHPAILPVLNPYHNVCIRHLIFVKNRYVALGKSMTAMSMGILAVEHAGKPPKETDGLCFTQLSWMETDKQPSNAAYHLYEITDQSLRQQIIKMLEPGRTIPSNLH
ncbi:8-oxo-dGDP phosphatase NUDT18-like, partial [Saccoglossus kowalevskii]